MSHVEVVETVLIQAPIAQVRAQFADVRHHAAAEVHNGVEFEMLEELAEGCRYRQVTRVGPFRLAQEMRLTVQLDGTMVNDVLSGQFAGGSITFTVSEDSDGSLVEARLRAQLRLGERLIAPVLRRKVSSALRAALLEDRDDLESGNYELCTNS